MKRGQISLDLLFALVLVSLTVLGLIVSGASQTEEMKTLGRGMELKVFVVDIRDSVAKVYASGPGITLQKKPPFQLYPGDWINITLTTNQTVIVNAQLNGKHYLVIQRLQVPVFSQSSVLLTPGNDTFEITSMTSPDGGISVVLQR